MEMAGYKEPLSLGMVMGETAVKLGHRREEGSGWGNSRFLGGKSAEMSLGAADTSVCATSLTHNPYPMKCP